MKRPVRSYVRRTPKHSSRSRSTARPYDVTSGIISFETGGLDDEETLELFSHLVKSGLAWQLQGSYGRMASSLIETGYLDRKGNILKHPGEE